MFPKDDARLNLDAPGDAGSVGGYRSHRGVDGSLVDAGASGSPVRILTSLAAPNWDHFSVR